MAVTAHTRRLAHAALGLYAGDNLCDIVDAGTGSINAATVRKLEVAMGNRKAAGLLKTAVNADTAINGYTQRHLANALGSQVAAQDIADELG